MLDRFGLAGIRVSTDRTSYLPGEEVVVRVEAPARRAPELARAAVELVRTERVPGGQRKKGAGDERTDRGGTFDLDPRSNADEVAVGILFGLVYGVLWLVQGALTLGRRAARQPPVDVSGAVAARRELAGAIATAESSDRRIAYSVRLALPDPAPPTGSIPDLEVAWSARVVTPRRRRPDMLAAARFAVLAPPGLYARLGGARTADKPTPTAGHDCELDLTLATAAAMPGQRVEGRFTVTAHTSMRVAAVRVELVRRTAGARGEGRQDAIVARAPVTRGGKLAAGERREFPFTFAIPPQACPSLRVTGADVGWHVRAELLRNLRPIDRVVHPLTVYNAPLAEGTPAR